MVLPANVEYSTVRGRFLAAVGDGADEGREPDGVPIEGLTIVLSADLSPAIARNVSASPPVTILIEPITCTTNADGVLLGPDGSPDVLLVASNDPDLDPHDWTYKARLTSARLGQVSFSFVAPAGEVVDLTTVIPVPARPGTDIPAWIAAVAQVEAAQAAAEVAAGEAEAAAAAAVAVGTTNDTIMTAVAGDPGSAFSGALSSKIGVATAGRSVRPALHALGDSLSANGVQFSAAGLFANNAQNPWVWASILSSGKLVVGKIGATGGHQTGQIIADHLAAVVASTVPGDYVAVLAGTNDITQAIPLATIETNLAAMYDAVVAVGGVPVACSIPPRDSDDATLAGNRLKLNMWIERNARARGIPFLDFYRVLADPAQLGKFTTGLNTDATHPNGPGARAMGTLAASVLTPPDAAQPYLATFTSGTSTDPTGATLMGNACMVTDSNANNVPDQFNTLSGTLSGGSEYARDTVEGVAGKMFRVTRGASGPTNLLAQTSPSAVAITPGHVVEVAFRFKFEVAAGDPDLSPSDNGKTFCYLLSGDGTSLAGFHTWDTPTPLSTFVTRFVMPDVATDNLMFHISARDGQCSVSIGQLTIRDLTALGLA